MIDRTVMYKVTVLLTFASLNLYIIIFVHAYSMLKPTFHKSCVLFGYFSHL